MYNDPTGHNQCDSIAQGSARDACNKSEATKIYNDMKDESDIAFNFPKDGCYARAHLMTLRILEKYGVATGKVWAIVASGLNLLEVNTNGPYGQVNWRYHVAPTITISNSDGTSSTMVIDPSIEDGPVSIEQWTSTMGVDEEGYAANGNSSESDDPDPLYWVSVQTTDIGVAPRIPDVSTSSLTKESFPGSGYWPGDDPEWGIDFDAANTMKFYTQLYNRCLETGICQ